MTADPKAAAKGSCPRFSTNNSMCCGHVAADGVQFHGRGVVPLGTSKAHVLKNSLGSRL